MPPSSASRAGRTHAGSLSLPRTARRHRVVGGELAGGSVGRSGQAQRLSCRHRAAEGWELTGSDAVRQRTVAPLATRPPSHDATCQGMRMPRRASLLCAAAGGRRRGIPLRAERSVEPALNTGCSPTAQPPRPPRTLTARSAHCRPGRVARSRSPTRRRTRPIGNASDFGPHVDDQRAMYWRNQTKPDNFVRPTGTPATPRSGVRIYRDRSGVPLVYGSNGYNVWYGAGYAAATDRLFEMDAIRRLAEGRLG